MKRIIISKLVEEVLRESQELSINEAIEKTKEKLNEILRRTPSLEAPKVSYHNVKKSLEKCVRKEKATKIRKNGVDVYRWIDPQTSLITFTRLPRSRLEWENLQREEPTLVYYLIEILRRETDFNKIEEMVKKCAKYIAEEDPIELYFKFIKWVWEKWNKKLEEINNENISHKKSRLVREASKIEEFFKRTFNRGLGIPIRLMTLYKKWDKRRKIYKPVLPGKNEEFTPNWEKIKLHLQSRIFGDKFILNFKYQTVETCKAVGTDASYQYISANDIIPSFYPRGTPIGIITSVGAIYDVSKYKTDALDVRPKPDTWEEYSKTKAEEEGIFISPEIYIREPDMWKRIIEASMDARQYSHEAEYFITTEEGKKIDIIFRDGRIFPLEHVVEDFLHIGDHGRYVRNSLRRFLDVISKCGLSLGSTVYCGVVKQPHVLLISPLIFWYMKYSEHKIWEKMTEEEEMRLIFESAIPDNIICTLLFSFLAKEDNSILSTFLVLNEFIDRSEIEEKLKCVTRNKDDILKALERECHQRGYSHIDDGDIELYGKLCELAAVVSFFCWDSSWKGRLADIPIWMFSIPRYEILIPYPFLLSFRENRDRKKFYRNVLELIEKVLSILSNPRILDIYDDFYRIDQRIIVPAPIKIAHQFTHDICIMYKNEFLAFLFSKMRE